MVHVARTGGPLKSTGKIALQSIFILVVILLSLIILKFTVVKQLAQSKSIYLDMSSGFQVDPDILAELARSDYLNGNSDKARLLYIRALDNFVLHTPSWLGLAQTLNDLGQKNKAVAVLQTLDNIKVENVDLLWKKAELARQLDQKKILLSTLNSLAQNDPLHKRRVFNLAGETWTDPLFLLQNFNSSHYPDILQLYIRSNQMEKAQTVWNELQKSPQQSSEATIAYVTFLLEHNEFDRAAAAWRETFQKNGPLLYNGNFESPLLNEAFGWQVTETKGMFLKNNAFKGGLTITFDGTENAAFMLSQVVPLFPGEYTFHGTFETTHLTSQQRPYWLISGYNCQGLHIEDAMLPPSEYTTEFAIPFVVPDSCRAVKIDLVRNRANDYDSLLSGSVTLNKLEITGVSLSTTGQPPENQIYNQMVETPDKEVVSRDVQPETSPSAETVVESPVSDEEVHEMTPSELPPVETKIFINSLVIRP